MTWLKLDDGIAEHPKFSALSDPGWSLWVRALVWAGKHRTDGRLPRTVVARLGARSAIRELVAARLWEPARGGDYVIHDFLDYNLDAHGRAARSAAGRKGAAHRWARPPGADDEGGGGSPASADDRGEPDPRRDPPMANRIETDSGSHGTPHPINGGGDGKPHPPVIPYSRNPENPGQKLPGDAAAPMADAGAFFRALRERFAPGEPEP